MGPEVVVPVQTVIQTSPWTPDKITALFTGLGILLAALFAGITSILAQLRANKKAGEEAGVHRDAKLDAIKILVDGPVSEQLRQIADLLAEKAATTGGDADHALADDARKKSDQKDAQVAASLPATPPAEKS